MKVSVLIPCYNSVNYLEQTIRSVLDQTWKDLEIIIVDDGSTDGSFEIAKSFEGDQVRVFRQDNSGACKARNIAFEMSTGEFIQYLDADDILSPDKIENQVKLIKGNKWSVASCRWSKFIGDIDSSVLQQLSIYRDYEEAKQMLIEMFSSFLMMTPHAWLVHRDLVIAAGPWNESLAINQDGEFFCRLLLKAHNVKFSGVGMAYYRVGISNSVSRLNGSRRKAESLLDSYILCKGHFGKELVEEHLRRAIATNFYYYIYIYYDVYPDLTRQAIAVVRSLKVLPPVDIIGGDNFRKFVRFFGFFNVLRVRRIWRLFNG